LEDRVIVADWLHGQATRAAQRPALLPDGAPPVTWAELDADASSLAAALAAAGVKHGERVAAVLRNGRTLVALLHASARVRALLVLVDPRLPPSESMALAGATSPALVVGEGATLPAARAVAQCSGACLALSELDAARSGRAAEALRAELARAIAGGAFGAGRELGGEPTIELDAPHTIVFSSGTSGRARPIPLTAGNHLWSALSSAARLGSLADDRWLACLPMAHVGGLSIALRAAIGGASIVLHVGFDADRVARSLLEDDVSLVSLVPTALGRTLDALGEARRDGIRLRAALIGGAGASAELLHRARSRGLSALPTYGLTEAASQVATLAPQQPLGGPGFVGHPLLATRVRIARGDGSLAACGEEGLIEIAGPTISPGVLREGAGRPSAPTAQILGTSLERCCAARGGDPAAPHVEADRLEPLADEDGWLATGDRGWLDAHGGLTVTGRHDDVIVSGGENVSPAEVEAALLELGLAAEAGVASAPDPEWGQAVAAWIVPPPGRSPSLEELRAALRGRLAPHQLPRRLFLVDALPKTALGKVRRKALRDAAER
jgi:O-succinylbenzoic acid--CoA ligase